MWTGAGGHRPKGGLGCGEGHRHNRGCRRGQESTTAADGERAAVVVAEGKGATVATTWTVVGGRGEVFLF